MPRVERNGNISYVAFGTEATKGVPVTPTFFGLLYDINIATDHNWQKQQPAAGSMFATYNALPGQRSHTGDLTVPADPNMAAHIADMNLARISNSGSGPFVNVFGFSSTVMPKSKTIDVYRGNVVTRYWGVEGSNFTPTYDNNEVQLKTGISALGSFESRTIASVTTTTITLDATYSPIPNKGLVVGDLVRIYKESTGAVLDTTVATVNADGITVTLGASAAAFAAGDIISLRAAVPTLSLLQNFLWANTRFQFADTVTNALAATQTRIEKGSNWEIMYPFEDDGGSKRSGDFDPASLPRNPGDAKVTIKQFFDTPEQIQDMNDRVKGAIVVRHLAGATNQYELRAAFYALTTSNPISPIKSGSINYATADMIPSTNLTDGNNVLITVTHGLSSF